MHDSVTPVILTYNEAPNIGRTLSRLGWAKDIVVVDSFSDDETMDIVSSFPKTRIFQRRFDSHSAQWNFAISETMIKTDWVLAMDADYILTDRFVEDLGRMSSDEAISGYRSSFIYCIYGRRLRGTVYRPVTVLFRKERATYIQDGHTQCVKVDGRISDLSSPILHDDRKPLGRWLSSQDKYMTLEVNKLRETSWKKLGWADRLRKMRIPFPFIMFAYCLFIKGALFDGWPGIYYSLQRFTAEAILSLHLIEADIRRDRTG